MELGSGEQNWVELIAQPECYVGDGNTQPGMEDFVMPVLFGEQYVALPVQQVQFAPQGAIPIMQRLPQGAHMQPAARQTFIPGQPSTSGTLSVAGTTPRESPALPPALVPCCLHTLSNMSEHPVCWTKPDRPALGHADPQGALPPGAYAVENAIREAVVGAESTAKASVGAGSGEIKSHGRKGPCSHCGAIKSPLWRRHPQMTSRTLCNACGLRVTRGKPLAPVRDPARRPRGSKPQR